MAKISPLSEVHPTASLGDDCEVGPFCVVGPHVTLGPRNRLLSHVVITGHTAVGSGNTFHPHSVIGAIPQDKKFRGETTKVIIGNDNSIREAVTIHAGTALGGSITRLGNDNLLMVNCHVGHDCQIGDHCVFANNVMLAGHVVIGNFVVMSGLAGTHHYVSIGDYVFVAGAARIHHDVPPFVKVSDDDRIRAINKEGLKRAGFSAEEIEQIDDAARRLFFKREKSFTQALADFDTLNGLPPHVKTMIEFLRRRDSGKHGRYLEGLRHKKS